MDMDEIELCFPQMPNLSCRVTRVDPSVNLLNHLVLGSLSFLITSLNLLVILSIACFRQLQSSTNRILLSLAVSDFLVGLVVIPTTIRTWGSCWVWGDFACGLYYYFSVTVTMASVISMVLISVDRYIAVVDPMHYQYHMSTFKVNLGICLNWAFSVLFCFIIMSDIVNFTKHSRCLGQCSVNVLFEADILLAWVLPFAIIVVLYTHIFSVVVRKVKNTHSEQSTSQVKNRSELKAARNLGSVIVSYLICYIPYYVVNAVVDVMDTQSGTTMFVCLIMMCLNSAVNPLIYVLIYPNFRKAFRAILSLAILYSRPVLV